jgi:uncharacterized SAM-binding protein YcdF (DUF218 family)
MRVLRLKKTILPFSFVFTIGVGCVVFRNLDRWLEISDPLPGRIDVLFTLSGEDSRLQYSSELFSEHRASFWLISNPDKKITGALQAVGIDTTRIFVVDSCANTRSEIAFLKQWILTDPRAGRIPLKDAGQGAPMACSVGIVSNWYHMRRTQLIAKNLLGGNFFPCLYLAVPHRFDAYYRDLKKAWWRQRIVRNVVLLEWKKIVYYFFMHPLLVFSMSSTGQ